MVKQTKLYNNKRKILLELTKALDGCSRIDYDTMVSFFPKIKESKSTINLNRVIKQMNSIWKNLNLQMVF